MNEIDEYGLFCRNKIRKVEPCGVTGDIRLPPGMFDFQADITTWALRGGRRAVFAATGLGKTRMQVAWAANVPGNVLILAPLAVADQTVSEASKLGVTVKHCFDQSDVEPGVISITNYDRLHKFNTGSFNAVVADESSIIKHHDSKTLTAMLDAFESTPYKLCCTATPSPNDYVELGTHAEFLGICSRTEMLSEFFCHDGGETQKWRLKGHARRAFWKWVSEWAALVRSPEDLGYDGSAYKLPELSITHHTVESDHSEARETGTLFKLEAKTLLERRSARRATIKSRALECASIVNTSGDQWVVWCDLNAESEELTKSIVGAVEVKGADSTEEKERRIRSFLSGESRVLVSKPSICGFGLNMQVAHHMAFVGVTDSWEAYHQAVRREWRFGQKHPVDVHIFASDIEGAVIANLERKERDAEAMANELAKETAFSVREQVRPTQRMTIEYDAQEDVILPVWMR